MAMPACLEHVSVTTDALCAVAPAQRTYGHILSCKATAASIAGVLSQVWRCSSSHAAVSRRDSVPGAFKGRVELQVVRKEEACPAYIAGSPSPPTINYKYL
jgi:hypothetical protein